MVDEEPQLTVGALIELLRQYPESTPVAYWARSESNPLLASDIGPLVDLFDNGGYCSRPYQVKDQARVVKTLVFPGN